MLRGAAMSTQRLSLAWRHGEARRGAPSPPWLACRYTTIVIFFTGTMSVLTIIVQGSTMPLVLSWLGLTKKTPVQIQHLLMAAKEVEEYADRNLAHLRVRSAASACHVLEPTLSIVPPCLHKVRGTC